MTRRTWRTAWRGRLPDLTLRRILEASEDLSSAGLLAHLDEPLTGPAEVWAERVANGEPLDYVRGFSFFRNRRYRVTPETLIPRDDTEAVLEAALSLPGRRVLDVGTGSGILAGEIARAQPGRAVAAVDLSPGAAQVARQNVPSEVLVVNGDLVSPFRDKSFDLVVANPPYVDDDYPLPREMRDEPRLALFAGPDGMNVYRRLAHEAPRTLTPGGWIVLEIGAGQGPLVAQVFATNPVWGPLREMGRTGPENHLRAVAFQKSSM